MPITIDSVPTPCIVIDLRTVRKNLQKLAAYARGHTLNVRPHFKTHKSLFMARLQQEAGAVGFACAKVGEAQTLAPAASDILLAYPALDPARTSRLASLAHSTRLRVAVDSKLAVERLAAAAASANGSIGILIDMDVGFHRTGVQSPEEAVALAIQASKTRGATFDGLFVYPGHIHAPASEQAPLLQEVEAILQATLAQLKRAGLPAPIISGGSTPTAYQSHLVPSLTEIRPGTYIYNDRNTLAGNYCELEDCAAQILATVVSNAVPGKVVVDAGTKTLTSDRLGKDSNAGHGLLPRYPAARITRLSEEHGEIDITSLSNPPKLGDRVCIIPNHICPCINLQDSVWLQEGSETLHPMPIEARGLLI